MIRQWGESRPPRNDIASPGSEAFHSVRGRFAKGSRGGLADATSDPLPRRPEFDIGGSDMRL
ncbi:MAG: hypothetical protein Kow0013_21250 [Pararhodobacter sp.]